MIMKVLLNMLWGKFDIIRWLDALCQRAKQLMSLPSDMFFGYFRYASLRFAFEYCTLAQVKLQHKTSQPK